MFISGEKGLSEEVVQAHQTVVRRLVFTRDTAKLFDLKSKGMIDLKSVVAVVISGRFASLAQIKDQVQHLGKTTLPVFVLSEAEAWGQMVTEEFPEMDQLAMVPLIWTRNPVTLLARLGSVVQGGEIDADIFRYLRDGPSSYEAMLKRLGVPGLSRTSSPDPPEHERTPGFVLFEKHKRMYVRLSRVPTAPSDMISPPLHTFSPDSILIQGGGISVLRDRETMGLILYPGGIVDSGARSAQIRRDVNGSVVLDRRTEDRYAALLDQVTVTQSQEGGWKASLHEIDRLGKLSFGHVRLSGNVLGYRRYPNGNLDDLYEDTTSEKETTFDFQTFGLKWEPIATAGKGITLDVEVGLANILRLMFVTLFRYADQTVLVYPNKSGCIWVLELAVGGNGASSFLFENHKTLIQLLRGGGRVLLDCPCEGGFASASTPNILRLEDTGCPRCTRVAGFVIRANHSDRSDLYSKLSKRQTLQWLFANKYLPGSGEVHIQEKYGGIDDADRVVGEDNMSRRGCIKLIRRILRDRLGLEIEDQNIASLNWKPDLRENLGNYEPAKNRISIVKGLREWFALDVLAHELFHNYQHQSEGIFNYQILGESGSVKPPFNGKLFIEGSACWAESHIVDTLAIRSSLTVANLREGDEYGIGFQLFKYIEENSGVSAVLKFLASGDIASATNGKVKGVEQLYSLAGIKEKLNS